MEKDNKIIVFTGPTGVGKSTVIDYLKSNYNVNSPICFTTRKKRNEEDNEYIFVNKDEFLTLEENNLFFFVTGEDTKYGFLYKEYSNNLPIVMATSYGNALRLKKKNENAIIITLAYKDINKELIERISLRGEDPNNYRKRICYDLKDYNENFDEILKVSSLNLYTSLYSIEDVNRMVSDHLISIGIIKNEKMKKLVKE